MNVWVSTLEKVSQWARAQSLWYVHVGGGCCADELIAAQSCKYDMERLGCLPQTHPEQADLLIVSTTVTEKMAEHLRQLYEAMPSPKYVMAVGSCANRGGAFSSEVSYSTYDGLNQILPVDVYVPGCPPRPEAVMNGIIELQERIRGNKTHRRKN